MLVLTRRQGEGVWIGDDIRVTVQEIGDGNVRLGIHADRSIKVLRDELKRRIDCGQGASDEQPGDQL